MELVGEAAENGARRSKACEVLGLSLRMLQRWQKQPDRGDRRAGPNHITANSLSKEEKRLMIAVATSPQF